MQNKKVIKSLLTPALKVIASLYLRRERFYSYNGLRVRISPGVFHPGLFFSTKILLDHLNNLDLKGKKVLELGAGSGLISITAASKGAISTASEISKTALDDLRVNSGLNHLPVKIIQSDLFAGIPDTDFDLIIINPPYFHLDPSKESKYAWYCGSGFQYFRKLFPQLKRFKNCSVIIDMILSEDCEIERIKEIASESDIVLKKVKEVTNWFEENYIYEIEFI
ncbi:MAG: methyltransferase [Syntrophomonadaceae bacterium]